MLTNAENTGENAEKRGKYAENCGFWNFSCGRRALQTPISRRGRVALRTRIICPPLVVTPRAPQLHTTRPTPAFPSQALLLISKCINPCVRLQFTICLQTTLFFGNLISGHEFTLIPSRQLAERAPNRTFNRCTLCRRGEIVRAGGLEISANENVLNGCCSCVRRWSAECRNETELRTFTMVSLLQIGDGQQEIFGWRPRTVVVLWLGEPLYRLWVAVFKDDLQFGVDIWELGNL